MERMVNQNTYDDIAQGGQYIEYVVGSIYIEYDDIAQQYILRVQTCLAQVWPAVSPINLLGMLEFYCRFNKNSLAAIFDRIHHFIDIAFFALLLYYGLFLAVVESLRSQISSVFH